MVGMPLMTTNQKGKRSNEVIFDVCYGKPLILCLQLLLPILLGMLLAVMRLQGGRNCCIPSVVV